MISQLARLLSGNRDLSTFLVCAAVSFVLMKLPERTREPAARALQAVTTRPFVTFANRLSGSDSPREVEKLNNVVAYLLRELTTYREADEDLRARVQSLQDNAGVQITFREGPQFAFLPARITEIPGGRVTERMKIDLGDTNGVRVGDPVVTPQGLVGKIVNVSPHSAELEPLGSPSFAASVETDTTHVRGVISPTIGPASGPLTLRMDFVETRWEIKKDEGISTSGLGGIFPAKIPVGRITSVRDGPGQKEIEVQPYVDFSRLKYVYVLSDSLPAGRLTEDEERILREIEAQVEEDE